MACILFTIFFSDLCNLQYTVSGHCENSSASPCASVQRTALIHFHLPLVVLWFKSLFAGLYKPWELVEHRAVCLSYFSPWCYLWLEGHGNIHLYSIEFMSRELKLKKSYIQCYFSGRSSITSEVQCSLLFLPLFSLSSNPNGLFLFLILFLIIGLVQKWNIWHGKKILWQL